jgi:hypothetical protein
VGGIFYDSSHWFLPFCGHLYDFIPLFQHAIAPPWPGSIPIIVIVHLSYMSIYEDFSHTFFCM